MVKKACIAAITPYSFLPYSSGGQKLIAQFYQFLAKHFEIKVIAAAGNDATLENYHLQPLLGSGSGRYINPLLYHRIKKFIKENNAEVLIAEHPYHAWLLWMLKKTTDVKIILHSHNIEHERFRSLHKPWWQLMKKYEQLAFKTAHHCFLISDEDLQKAITTFHIAKNKCSVIPFGVLPSAIPADKAAAKKTICKELGVDESTTLLLFSAPYNYQPNVDALQAIIEKINPHLAQQFNKKYLIIVTGKSLPERFNNLKDEPNIIYKGFVNDIDMYFKGADVLLNPLLTGGGVKTKVIEAIGLNTTVVSTVSGALGINKNVCGDKLLIAEDNNWQQFSRLIQNLNEHTNTPTEFYEFYNLDNIVAKAATIISSLMK